MPKIGIFSGKEVCAILEGLGFANIRQSGSHIIMQQKTATGTITVPVPNHKEIKIGTLQSIIRQSGAKKTNFMR
ncbi:MAG: type II toxin-antitoxin system HicA family toxin [Spirochaetes bacterium]|nr:type II toxin-antitoxin system HicA family toxin [Spirochaetota bacterium]